MELSVRGAPVPHWMQDLGTRWNADVRLHVCRRADGGANQLLQLIEVNADPAVLPEITEFFQQHPVPQDVSLTQLAPNRLLVRLVGPLPPLCHTVFEMGAICMSCPFLPARDAGGAAGEEGTWKVLVHRIRDAHPLLDSFAAPGTAPATLVRIGALRGPHNLTARQEQAVSTAFLLGYFDFPRRVQLKDVANALGVGRATAMENLRRGMRKLVSRHRTRIGVVRATSS